MPTPPTEIWRTPLKWAWTYDSEPGAGGTEYSVEIQPDAIAWAYSEDRWGRSEQQSHADFAEFGPLWSAPDEVLGELAGHFGLQGKPWQKPGWVDYSPVWWAVDFAKPEALGLLVPEDAHRRYHGQRTLLMLAAEKNAVEIIKRLLATGADPNARDEKGLTAADYLAQRQDASAELIALLAASAR